MDTVKKENHLRIYGMPWPFFLVGTAIMLLGMFFEILPDNLLTAWVFASFFGFFLMWLGNRTKLFRTIGASSLFAMLIPAILVATGIIPESVTDILSNFFSGYSFLDVFVAALMTGSILGIDATLLKKALLRYLIPMLSALLFALVAAGLLGEVLGYGAKDAVLNIALPICGSGTGAGAVPMAQIYERTLGGNTGDYMSALVPAVTIANLLCVFIASFYNATGKNPDKPFKGYSGQGQIMRISTDFTVSDEKQEPPSHEKMIVGLLMSGTFYMCGILLNALLWSDIHPYAWTCILLVAYKLSGKCPQYLSSCAGDWYNFIGTYGTPPMLVAVGISLINLQELLFVVSNPSYLLIIVVVTVVIALVAGLVGYLLGMNFVEISLTAGLCMANSGGGGDVAVLGAAQRMNLMPFAAISSRIGGSIILIVASFCSQLFA